MRNTWLAEQLQSISEEPNSFIIEETIKYIEQLEDDNESLQVALEGTIWSCLLYTSDAADDAAIV
ncbi:hypothetical protein ACMUMT_06085 [Enterococcus faecalis]|uniref:hypothetical protein n=1 Tax=Enterococcus faecalis TaxID=1351 RepID=UPI003B774284